MSIVVDGDGEDRRPKMQMTTRELLVQELVDALSAAQALTIETDIEVLYCTDRTTLGWIASLLREGLAHEQHTDVVTE